MSRKNAHPKSHSSSEHAAGYTPREKKIMIFGFAGIALVLACLIILPDLPDYVEKFHRMFYDYIKVEDGVAQGVGDNWLIANLNETSSDPAYVKLAEVGDVEGYEPSESDYVSDENVLYHDYASASDGVAQKLRFMSASGEASEVPESFASRIGMVLTEVLYQSEPEQVDVGGREAYGFLVEGRTQTNEDEENPVYEYSQNVYLYVDSDIDGCSVLVNAINEGEDESAFADRDAMFELAERAAQSLIFE